MGRGRTNVKKKNVEHDTTRFYFGNFAQLYNAVTYSARRCGQST